MNATSKEYSQECPEVVESGMLPTQPSSIAALEKAMLSMEQVDCKTVHRFGPGVYMREITVPAGTNMIGHEHKTDHVCIFLKGRITLIDENGVSAELTAPMIINSKPGRKIAHVHEEMVWINIHATEETDLDKLEEMLVVKSAVFIEHEEAQKRIEV